MPLRIVSWNINSVRLRLSLLQRVVKLTKADVLCLQETKVDNPLFPLLELQACGFPHLLYFGQKSYNGVAILSRVPIEPLTQEYFIPNDQRHIGAVLPGGIELHNLYIPAGGDIPDPKLNPKFASKLAFLDKLTHWSAKQHKEKRSIILGDFNIAPLPEDVWSHKALLDVVSHTPIEVEKLSLLQQSAGWVDGIRHFTPAPEKLYSWWSYRAQDWEKSDRGRRLDHIWATPALTPQLKSAKIYKEVRGWEQPSDHVPVMLELDI